jgi:hypothetical protein
MNSAWGQDLLGLMNNDKYVSPRMGAIPLCILGPRMRMVFPICEGKSQGNHQILRVQAGNAKKFAYGESQYA